MPETAQATAFFNQEGKSGNTLYILLIQRTLTQALYWEGDRMDWTTNKADATRYSRDELEKAGNTAQKYAPHPLIIEAVERFVL